MNSKLFLRGFFLFLLIFENTSSVKYDCESSTCNLVTYIFRYNPCQNRNSDFVVNQNKKYSTPNINPPQIFLFYDVNHVEGFNLRRDVYIRMAVFLKNLMNRKEYENVKLVLPPFHRLYHWRDRRSDGVFFWNHFFHMDGLKSYANVIDTWEYFEIMKRRGHKASKYVIDHVVRLKHFASMFNTGKFEDKFEFGACDGKDLSRKMGSHFHQVYANFTIAQFHCVEFQGGATLLYDLIEKLPRS